MAKYDAATREILMWGIGGLVAASLVGWAWSSEQQDPIQRAKPTSLEQVK
ncbi:hypothetical protein [Leptolyngbya sp. FACHB-261]|nr:hypothetical protein [Leptolyngbya sp. FACHB-261]MBD2102068.1 hypothetical protein [Leptolyngbya sp. FACHB-261]